LNHRAVEDEGFNVWNIPALMIGVYQRWDWDLPGENWDIPVGCFDLKSLFVGMIAKQGAGGENKQRIG
jgi:hypothetical protein